MDLPANRADLLRQIENERAALEQVLATVAGAMHIGPDRFAWRGGSPLVVLVASNTCWHYREHREQIAKIAR
jgi:hypothetical protein